MRFDRLKHARKRIMRAPRSTEGFRALVAAAGIACLLLLVFVMAGGMRTANLTGSAQRPDASAAQPRQDAWEHRLGSIVFASWKQLCEEWRFDNLTGQIVSAEYVDCEARLGQGNADAAAAVHDQNTRMRGVLAGFKK